jgi:hypothetical protein
MQSAMCCSMHMKHAHEIQTHVCCKLYNSNTCVSQHQSMYLSLSPPPPRARQNSAQHCLLTSLAASLSVQLSVMCMSEQI